MGRQISTDTKLYRKHFLTLTDIEKDRKNAFSKIWGVKFLPTQNRTETILRPMDVKKKRENIASSKIWDIKFLPTQNVTESIYYI